MAQITAGILLQYAPDNVIPWDPSAGGAAIADITGDWVTVDDITEMPEIGAAPDTLETTALQNLTYKTYLPGLLDSGGTVAMKANDSKKFRDDIDDLELALASGKIWFRINIPEPVNQSMIFSGDIAPLGFGGASVNSVLQTTLNVIPDCEPVWLDNE